MHTPTAAPVPLRSHGFATPTSRGGSVAPTSRGGSVAPTSHGGSVAPTSRGGSVVLTSRGGSVVPTSRGGSVVPTSRGGSISSISRVGPALISRRGSTAPGSRVVSSLSFRGGSAPAYGSSTDIPAPITTGTLQRNTSFSTSPDFAAPRPTSPFDFNSDDYESQVPTEWYVKHAAAHANHFPVEGTHIEQPGVSVVISCSSSNIYWSGSGYR